MTTTLDSDRIVAVLRQTIDREFGRQATLTDDDIRARLTTELESETGPNGATVTSLSFDNDVHIATNLAGIRALRAAGVAIDVYEGQFDIDAIESCEDAAVNGIVALSTTPTFTIQGIYAPKGADLYDILAATPLTTRSASIDEDGTVLGLWVYCD